VIIFGATGDLTSRKLVPALASLNHKKKPPEGLVIIGVARRAKTDAEFREDLRKEIPPDMLGMFDELAPNIFYQAGDVGTESDLIALATRLDSMPGGSQAGRLFYLALKPDLFAPTVEHLSSGGLLKQRENEATAWRRVIIEKPFGHDLGSALELNGALHEHLREDQIYRIDHYLGKETVQNIIGFRFHNAIFEPIWNRHHVELVQITVAEDLGMESGRGGYYDTSGAVRDMVQNHMLQVLSLITMEAPASLDAKFIRGQKVDVLESLVTPTFEDVKKSSVRAQYTAGTINGKPVPGYRQEQGVSPESKTETFVAIRTAIESWRWGGVPFFLRHGKRLPKKFTEVQVQFRMPPIQLFNHPEGVKDDDFRRMIHDGSLVQMRPNVLTISIQPREAITLSFGVKTPGNNMIMAPAKMSFDYRERFGTLAAPAYERLLLDALLGDATLFLRGDEIEASWVFADAFESAWARPDGPPVLEYPAGTWGPPEADALFGDVDGAWSHG
jgi:glucose-6-phosphate 1-dehydrogenase